MISTRGLQTASAYGKTQAHPVFAGRKQFSKTDLERIAELERKLEERPKYLVPNSVLYASIFGSLMMLLALVGQTVMSSEQRLNQEQAFAQQCDKIPATEPIQKTVCILPGFDSPNPAIRRYALTQLGTIQATDAQKADILTHALRDPDVSVYKAATVALDQHLQTADPNAPITQKLAELKAEGPACIQLER
jgi:hypothetical protein